MTQRYELAIRAARAAGKVLRAKFYGTRAVKSKGKRDIVTDADFAADHTLREIIHARFPRDHFLSEEDPAATREKLWDKARGANGDYLWIADPLDGTTNYARRVPVFCTSLALYHAGAVHVGAVYDPLLDELYSAERGRGAFLNGKPIRASATRKFIDAVIGAEWSRDETLRARTAKIFSAMLMDAMTGRALGSAALTLCYVAAGRVDGYVHLSLAPWDVAAAALIVEEAGGKITTPTGARWDVHSRAYVASNGIFHSRLLRFCKS
ncbi:MAG: inositol monophosphatase [Chloroflexi bacterium]|nr:inositol monophosphatase [Chloroflexota bacterium]